MHRNFVLAALSLLGLASAPSCLAQAADPVDEVHHRNFYIMPIGLWNLSTMDEFRNSMLSKTGGVEPPNIKLGVCEVTSFFMQHTQGSYYDYIYEPYYPQDNASVARGWEVHRLMQHAEAANMRVGSHVNGMPWGDSENQSLDNLHNYLEKYPDGQGNRGWFLQRDSSNRMRTGSSQDPTFNESTGSFPALEMQLTLSRNAAIPQAYWKRNALQSLRLFQYYRDIHPDLVVFVSGSSEVAQNIHANDAYADYSAWSVQEFRDWLGGTGLYVGKGQYATVALLNSFITGGTGGSPPGFPLSSFAVAQPPTAVNWNSSTRQGRWWILWNQFRVHQVTQLVQAQATLAYQSGWSPDRVFGHQIPMPEMISGTESQRKYATPARTTFGFNGGNGVTTYLDDALDSSLFSFLASEDPMWGIFEYNPIIDLNNFATKARSDLSLSRVWNANGHIISPYLWDGGLTGLLQVYTIRTRPMEVALQDFIRDRQTSRTAGIEPWQAHPDSRSPIWTMNQVSDLQAIIGLTGGNFSRGKFSATTTAPEPRMDLRLSPGRTLQGNQYGEASFRMAVADTTPGRMGRFVWLDETSATHSIDFPITPGMNVYRLHLGPRSGWNGKRVSNLGLLPVLQSPGTAITLDWFQLKANHYWPLDAAGEIGGVSGFAPGFGISNGQFLGTDNNNDGYLYFSTDKTGGSVDADRVSIDAKSHPIVQFRMTSSAPNFAQIFWWRRGESFQSHVVPVQAGTQTYTINMASHPEWTGEITRIRLDPVNQTGITVALDDFGLRSAMLAPLPLVDDVILNTEYPYLAWDQPVQQVSGPVLYDLEIARDFEFTQITANPQGLAQSTYVHNGTPALSNGDYWWRVRSRHPSTGSRSDWSYPMPIHLRKWHFNTREDIYSSTAPIQFRPEDIAPPVITVDGTLITTASDNNSSGFTSAFFTFNNGGDLARGVNADSYSRFRLRYRINNANRASAVAQVFFFKEDGQTNNVALPPSPTNNTWLELDVDMAAHPQWFGHIQRIRFDPAFEAGQHSIELDWAEIAPALVPPVPVSLSEFWIE